MKAFDNRTYSISDFVEWNSNGLLELSPDFQRRSVWSEKAKSYLIDTIIRGKPMPKIIISQKLEGTRTIRVVIDGQQRLRSIFDYRNGDFKLSRAHNREYAGCTYDQLPQEMRNDFLKYELGVDVIFDMEYPDILDIFSRINSYTVTLNQQEKFNAKYLGYFKQFVYEYGHKYVQYFVQAGILSKARVTRMEEAALSADLFIALIDQVQTNKNNEQYYKKYEDEIGDLEAVANKFDNIMSWIGQIYPPEVLANTNWSRIHLFYTLFTSVAHLLYSLKGPDPQLRKQANEKQIGKIRVALDEISAKYDLVSEDMENPNHPDDYKKFITRSRRGTTDSIARIERTNFVCEKLLSYL